MGKSVGNRMIWASAFITICAWSSLICQARDSGARDCTIPDVPQYYYLMGGPPQLQSISSLGAGPCVIVTLFDPVTHLGLVAHISASIDARKSMDLFFAEFRRRGVPSSRLEARLIGGWKGFSDQTVQTLRTSIRQAHAQSKEEDVLSDIGITLSTANFSELEGRKVDPSCNCSRPIQAVKSIRLNLETGQVSDVNVGTCPNDNPGTPTPAFNYVRMPEKAF